MKTKIKTFIESFRYRLHLFRMRVRELTGATPQLEQQQFAISWPPAVDGTVTGLLIEGKTTIRWGTRGLLQVKDAASEFLVVLRFNQAPKQEVNYLTNGNGVQTTRCRLTHGHQWDVTVRDDTSISNAMKAGDTIVITDAAGIVKPNTGNAAVGNVYTAEVIDPGYDTSPGQPGERTLRVEALTLIEGNTPGTAA